MNPIKSRSKSSKNAPSKLAPKMNGADVQILDIHIERSPTRRVVDDEAQSSTLEKGDENEN